MRDPIVDGRFYPNDPEELEKEIKELLVESKNKKIGIISSHAGYMFSGKCMGRVYGYLNSAKRVIIIGPNHTGYGSSKLGVSKEDFITPLGRAKVDLEFIGKLLKNSLVKVDEEAHKFEHSLEVQLPFLQYIFKDKLRIVPLVVSFLEKNEIAELANFISELEDFVLVISSDFTHYGENYSYKPFSGDINKKVYKLDKKAINLICNLDLDGFLDYTKDKTICGYLAIALGIEIVKNLGCKKGKLVEYYTSGDITKDYSNIVGYGGIIFE